MNKYLKIFMLVIYVLFIDFIWIYLINKKNYTESIEKVQKNKPVFNFNYAIFTYFLVMISIIYLSVPFVKSKFTNKDSKKNKIVKSLLYGAFVGFIIYGVYNFTCLSIYKNYEFKVGLMDSLWGAFLYASSTTLYLLG
jgi:uncharacterized membrane protein